MTAAIPGKKAPPIGSDADQSHHDLAQGRFHLVWLDERDENGFMVCAMLEPSMEAILGSGL